ncbi:MAG TPA: TfuA-like protein [Actinocrinis sp.]|nr:TfuA-like protein [Actinocrinis sp.]
MKVHVYAGPTLPRADILTVIPSATVQPPVAHGDLFRADNQPGDIVVLIDGLFHQVASVRHKEILQLLADGVRVVGCSSMGALRAAELYPYGMIGHGAVFEMYRQGTIDADDEVAVMHGAAPEYRRMSDSLVVFRYAVAGALEAGEIDRRGAETIIRHAAALHYTERRWDALEALCGDDPESRDAFARLRAFVAAHPGRADVKATDAIDTLTRLAELTSGETPPLESWAPKSREWHNGHLYDWRSRFRGALVDGVHAGDADVLRYHQLYGDDFPDRWKRFVVAQIEAAAADGTDAPAWLAVAGAWGLTTRSVTPEQYTYWLLDDEVESLAPEDRLLTLLVRSFVHLSPDLLLAAAEPELLADEPVRRAVAESFVINDHLATWGTGERGVSFIKPDVLRRHLAETWKVPEHDERSLRAAARDRGFDSVESAARAARPFFLRHWLRASDPVLPLASLA